MAMIGECTEGTIGAHAEAVNAEEAGWLRRVDTGKYEAPTAGVEYYSPAHNGSMQGEVYRQYVTQVGCPGGSVTSINFAYEITGIVIDYSYVVDLGSGWVEKLPYIHRTDSNWSVELRVYSTGFWVECGANNSCGTAGLAWVDYTKA